MKSSLMVSFVTDGNNFLVQESRDDGTFAIHSDDQTWQNGFGSPFGSNPFWAVAREDVPPEVEEDMGWILDNEE